MHIYIYAHAHGNLKLSSGIDYSPSYSLRYGLSKPEAVHTASLAVQPHPGPVLEALELLAGCHTHPALM